MQSELSIAPSRLRSVLLTQPAAPTPAALSRASTRDRRLRILRRRLTAQFARSSSRWMMPPRSRGLAVAIGATCRVCSTGDMPHGFGKLPRRAARFAPALGQRLMIVASELPRTPLAWTFPHCPGWIGRPQRRPLFFRPKNRERPRALRPRQLLRHRHLRRGVQPVALAVVAAAAAAAAGPRGAPVNSGAASVRPPQIPKVSEGHAAAARAARRTTTAPMMMRAMTATILMMLPRGTSPPGLHVPTRRGTCWTISTSLTRFAHASAPFKTCPTSHGRTGSPRKNGLWKQSAPLISRKTLKCRSARTR